MTNIGKTLIAAVVVFDLAFVAYLLVPKHDQEAAEAEAALTSAASPAAAGTQFSDTHVVAGSILPTTQSAIRKDSAEVAPQPTPAGNVVAALTPPVKAVTVAPQPAAQPQPPAQSQQPVRALPLADAKESFTTRSYATPRGDRARDDQHRSGSNAVAAAMTEQLVRESAKLDPSLPPPPAINPDDLRRRNSDPVGAAMTDQLVRESSRVTPAPQPSNQSGTQ